MQADIDVIWGCQPNKQLEVHWVNELLKSARVHHIDGHQQLKSSELNHTHYRILVESGLLLLESRVSEERKLVLHEQRLQRLKILRNGPPFLVIHLSDEEGFDGDLLYNMLPQSTRIWRNFPYDRFDQVAQIKSFPIGPRREFLDSQPTIPSSKRKWPWTFMGTLWRTGNRILATSIFLREHPNGNFFGGQSFGTGIPIEDYRTRMMESIFALCPEGDRHFDTFRLYESLEAGCIPLVVEREGQALRLLGDRFPAPVFRTWKDASQFVRTSINENKALNQLQYELLNWWAVTKTNISQDILEDLISARELNRYDFDTACGA